MTGTKNSFKGLLALLVSLSVVWAMVLSCVSMAVEVKTYPETIKVTQTVEENPTLTTYTYQLVPQTEGSPMPEGTKSGIYEFKLSGTDSISIPVELTADGEHNYQYELRRVEKTPDGDTVTPYSHLFGFLVRVGENGTWKIIPYTCYDNEFKIWDKVDEEGNPIGVTLPNTITGTKVTPVDPDKGDKGDKGDQGEKGEPGQDGEDGSDGKDGSNGVDGKDGTNGTNGTNGRNGTDGKNGTNGTNGVNGTTNVVTRTVNKIVNTGDPYQIGLWVGLIVVAAGGLIIVAIVRRKKEKDEENS